MSTRTPTSGAVRSRGTVVRRNLTAPVQLERRPNPADVAGRVPLFSIGDTEYTMPAVVHHGDVIKWTVQLAAITNEDVQGVILLRHLCGDKAADAILDDASMTEAQWKRIVEVMKDHTFGPNEREATEGN